MGGMGRNNKKATGGNPTPVCRQQNEEGQARQGNQGATAGRCRAKNGMHEARAGRGPPKGTSSGKGEGRGKGIKYGWGQGRWGKGGQGRERASCGKPQGKGRNTKL